MTVEKRKRIRTIGVSSVKSQKCVRMGNNRLSVESIKEARDASSSMAAVF